MCVEKRQPPFLYVGPFWLCLERIFTRHPSHSLPLTRYTPFFSCVSFSHTTSNTPQSTGNLVAQSPKQQRQTTGGDSHHHRFAVSFRLPCNHSATVAVPQGTPSFPLSNHHALCLTKLHILTFTFSFFPYPFSALISIHHTPHGRISGRFCISISVLRV